MKLFEYQAKECFAKFGISIPRGMVISSLQELQAAIETVGLPCVLKSQILRGGRGKLGLVRVVATAGEARNIAQELFASDYDIKKLLVEQYVDAAREYYLSVSLDAVRAEAVVMFCPSGGVDIETVSNEHPELIHRAYVNLFQGMDGAVASQLIYKAGITGKVASMLSRLILNLYACFEKYDAELAEINPVFITRQNEVIAGDGKLIIDDNSMFRQPEFKMTREYYSSDMEYEAAQQGIPYIQFDGDISLMCAGAGLTNAVYDLIQYEGGKVANYLEFGGPNYTKSEEALRLCLKNKSKVILIVTFGTIARADVIAEGVVAACAKLKPDRPLVTCIRGTNEEEAHKTLTDAGLECFNDTEQAVKRAIELAGKAEQ